MITILTQNPSVNQTNVPLISPITFVATLDMGLSYVSSKFYIDSILAFDSSLESLFIRPDFDGLFHLSGSLLTLKIKPRRKFQEDSLITIQYHLTLNSGSVVTSWSFHTARTVTRLLNQALQQTKLTTPSPIGVIEIFRQAALDALLPTQSLAAAPVVFYSMAQQSNLNSLIKALPSSTALSQEVSNLLESDIVSPVDATTKLNTVDVFWVSFLQVLIREQIFTPPIADLVNRAWQSGYPIERVGAVATALLYALVPTV